MSSPATPLALVAFTGRCELRWLRLLKPGFRHCFLVLFDGRRWLLYDPMSHVTDIRILPVPPGFDVFGWLIDHGCVVVPARPRTPPCRAAPPGVFTCVEAVKRALGIHARRVMTPWQLFRHLIRKRA